MNEPKIYYTDDYLAAAKECEKRGMQTFAAMLNQAAELNERAYKVFGHSAGCFGWTAYQIAKYILTGERSGK